MDFHIDEFYQSISDDLPHGHFREVIPLHSNSLSWAEVLEKVPHMQRGWYELSRISAKDRIEFTFDHWNQKLSYHPDLEKSLAAFFGALDDIGIYLVQRTRDAPFEAEMVYSLSNNNGFYRGALPIQEQDAINLQKHFPKYILPVDYITFLQIHDGFWKTTDTTGIIKSTLMPEQYVKFQNLLSQEPAITTSCGDSVEPASLIPFYESFGMPYFQCFWAEWYPEQEMGNVYYSSATKTISSIKCKDLASETLAFPTFNEWLAFYLERIE